MAGTHDLIVIGAGAAGLTAAGGAARLGLRVALIERDRMGGECLNTGCVPSKALLAAAKRGCDYAEARARVRAAVAAIAPHDSAERFRAWGVEVVHGSARFTGRRVVEVAGRRLDAARIVLAVGSRPAIPPVPGLAETPHLTNDTLWDLDRRPDHLLVLGGGPVGLEMAQAFRRLGAAVTVIEAGRPLSRDDPDAAALVLGRLRAEGVDFRIGARASGVGGVPGCVRVHLADGDVVEGTHLLVAAGRQAAVDGLGLDLAGVETGPDGIRVDRRCRTSNPRILAIGDCRAGPRLTHAAGHEGTVAVMNVALGLPAAVRYAALPWATFTDPELAQVGLTEAAARARHGTVTVVREFFADNDRALADGDADGFIKLVLARGRVVGATIVGTGAGEMVLPWALVIGGRATRWAISGAILPYPTRSELSKAAAFASYEGLIFGRWPRRWARLLARLRR